MSFRKNSLPLLLYYGYDIMNGRRITQYYNEAKNYNNHTVSSNETEVTNYLDKWGFDKKITKNPLMDKQDVREFAKKVADKKIASYAYTGGSYGRSLKVPYSKNRNFIRTATFRYYNEKGGYKLGAPFCLIRAKERSLILQYLRNEHLLIPYDVSQENLEHEVRQLKRKGVQIIIGYPSVMYELALFLERNPEWLRKLSIHSLISTSEMLEPEKRVFIKKVFQCRFVDRYSIEEVGLIAQQEEFGGHYYLNKYGIYPEVVNPETRQPVGEGETGKVVVTDIFNDLVPIVRYDTGDLATVREYRNGQLHSIESLLGRVSDQLKTTTGQPVSSLILGPYIYKPLSDAGLQNQFQFAQIGKKKYELRIKAPELIMQANRLNNEEMLGQRDKFQISMKPGELPDNGEMSPHMLEIIFDGLKSVLGKEANVNLKLMEDIPPQPSGKRPVYRNEWADK